MSDTVLVLAGIGQPPYALRGLSETLEPQDRGQLRQTINGDLVDLGDAARDRRYALRLSGGDVWPFPFGAVWRGLAVTVSCASHLGRQGSVAAGVTTVALEREPVPQSGRAVHASGAIATGVAFAQSSAGVWSATATFADTGLGSTAHVYYRPKLLCLINSWSQDFDEWAGRPGWSMELLERSLT